MVRIQGYTRTLQGGLIFIVAMTYIGLLFAIAHYGDKYADKWRASKLKPSIYALSMAVYCTSWTFYGAVGEAARAGWDYLPIYLGPALVFLLGFPIVRRLVALGREHDTSSIADFLSLRYGKSAAVGALGIGDGTRVVLYSTAELFWATRARWALYAMGFDSAVVLNGGYQSWTAEGRPVSTAPCAYPPATFTAHRRGNDPHLRMSSSERRCALP